MKHQKIEEEPANPNAESSASPDVKTKTENLQTTIQENLEQPSLSITNKDKSFSFLNINFVTLIIPFFLTYAMFKSLYNREDNKWEAKSIIVNMTQSPDIESPVIENITNITQPPVIQNVTQPSVIELPIFSPPDFRPLVFQREDERYLLNNFTNEEFKPIPISFHSDDFCINKRDIRLEFLCKIGINKYCRMSHVAEMIEYFWIIAPIYTYHQEKQKSYYRLHKNFRSEMESFGLSFCTIEAVRLWSDQKYMVTEPDREPYDIQITYKNELYLRENLLNVAIKKIPEDKWEYFAWIDGHQSFSNPYWWEEAIVKMHKYVTLQLFINTDRLNSSNQSNERPYGVIYTSTNQLDLFLGERKEIGNAYSISKEGYFKIGSILDTCVASYCDCLYAESIINPKANYRIRETEPGGQGYLMQFTDYVMETQKIVNGSSGYVRGELYHFQHLKSNFYTFTVVQVSETDFNVTTDLQRDENGTLYITNDEAGHLIGGLIYWYIMDFIKSEDY